MLVISEEKSQEKSKFVCKQKDNILDYQSEDE
jgi:hypothetical protein